MANRSTHPIRSSVERQTRRRSGPPAGRHASGLALLSAAYVLGGCLDFRVKDCADPPRDRLEGPCPASPSVGAEATSANQGLDPARDAPGGEEARAPEGEGSPELAPEQGSAQAPIVAPPETPSLFCPEVEFTTQRVLPRACAGSSYQVELHAKCALDEIEGLRELTWRPVSLPEGLELSAEGQLWGQPPAGRHTLRVAARVEGRLDVETSFELEALERCWVFALEQQGSLPSEDAGARAIQRLRARRLDQRNTSQLLPEQAPADESAVGFGVSSDGSVLAVVTETPTGERALRLSELGGAVIRPIALSVPGEYLGHAFSPDSALLAIATRQDTERFIEVYDLAVRVYEPPALLGRAAVAYDSLLTWSNQQRVMFFDDELTPPFLTLREIRVADGVMGPVTSPAYVAPPPELGGRLQLLPAATGTFILRGPNLNFYDPATVVVGTHGTDVALSPDLSLVAYVFEDRSQLRLREPDRFVTQPPTATAVGCSELLAWSAEGSHLLCREFSAETGMFTEALAVFELSPTFEVTPGPRGQHWLPERTNRVVLSRSGKYVALADDSRGFFLQRTEALSGPRPSTPSLPAPAGLQNWDFGFTRDERFAWARVDRQLHVAALDPPSPWRLLGDRLQVAPSCLRGLDVIVPSDPWCGAERLSDAVVTSNEGAFLAHREQDAIRLTDLESPREPITLSAQAPSQCLGPCFAFQ